MNQSFFGRTFVALTFLTILSGCATFQRSPSSVDADGGTAGAGALREAPPPGDLTDTGADLKAIPIAVNRQVLKWIDYFQGAGRPHMERYLSRSTRYMPVMKSILRKEGLPEDLIYIALIESGFSSTAHSSANAVGYWQFIRGTGKRYGMKIDSYVDERRDFVRATQGAAAYFKDLYGIFHSWYLAIASYNVGEHRVKKLVSKYRTRDFWQLARENKLPEETINYVPKFIAARMIAKEPEKYGFTDIEYMPPLEFAEVEFETSMDLRKLAKEMGLEYDDLRDLNPSYKRGVAFLKADKKLKLRVPKGTESQAVAGSTNSSPESVAVYKSDEDYNYYRIRRGDTIASIAKKFGTSQKAIRTLNNMGNGSRLSAGRRLRVPAEAISSHIAKGEPKPAKAPASVAPAPKNAADPALGLADKARDIAGEAGAVLKRSKSNAERADAKASDATRVHVVQKGDTLYEIARQYRVSLRQLTNHNKIGRRSKLSIGTRLEIP